MMTHILAMMDGSGVVAGIADFAMILSSLCLYVGVIGLVYGTLTWAPRRSLLLAFGIAGLTGVGLAALLCLVSILIPDRLVPDRFIAAAAASLVVPLVLNGILLTLAARQPGEITEDQPTVDQAACPPTPTPHKDDVRPPSRWALRLTLATVVALAVATLTVAIPWLGSGMNKVRWEQAQTQRGFRYLAQDIAEYREEEGQLPPAIDALPHAEDGWGRLFIYEIEGDDYTLTSLGRDGQPGGVGLDCDLTNGNPNPPECAPTREQILASPALHAMVQVGVGAGVIMFLYCCFFARPARLVAGQRTRLADKMLVTIAATTFFAMILASIHLIVGH
jgi:hypothetical protein